MFFYFVNIASLIASMDTAKCKNKYIRNSRNVIPKTCPKRTVDCKKLRLSNKNIREHVTKKRELQNVVISGKTLDRKSRGRKRARTKVSKQTKHIFVPRK